MTAKNDAIFAVALCIEAMIFMGKKIHNSQAICKLASDQLPDLGLTIHPIDTPIGKPPKPRYDPPIPPHHRSDAVPTTTTHRQLKPARYRCFCSIIPKDVLDRFAHDSKLSAAERQAFAEASQLEAAWRKARTAKMQFARLANSLVTTDASAPVAPSITVFDCQHRTALPGNLVDAPGNASDLAIKRAHDETQAVAEFFQSVFGRNSLDGAGMGLLSSVHYGKKYNNAFWNGTQMTYGDGDGDIFVDFTQSTDVIAHELSHGLTQFTVGLNYTNQAGGLNESLSDVFGSIFRQWRKGQTVAQADWLIGADILGPGARKRGYTCLRDMAKPNAKHCLSPQPTHFSQFKLGMDPHESSGIPNLAFYKAASALGGQSWDRAGPIWYAAMTQYAATPNLKMKTFADRTRNQAKRLYASDPAVLTAIDQAWRAVGL